MESRLSLVASPFFVTCLLPTVTPLHQQARR